jgi:hypothetical protein
MIVLQFLGDLAFLFRSVPNRLLSGSSDWLESTCMETPAFLAPTGYMQFREDPSAFEQYSVCCSVSVSRITRDTPNLRSSPYEKIIYQCPHALHRER